MMDKIKPVLAVIKKHYFWGLAALIVPLALISWAKATSGLVDQFTARKATLENDFKEMQNVSSISNHPNAAVIDALVKRKNALVDKVLQAWEVLYKEQNDKNKLPEGLSDDFKRAFEKTRQAYDKLKAGEKLKPGDQLADKMLDEYQYFIEEHFKAFFAIVDVLRPADEKKKPAKPGKLAMPFKPRGEAESGSGRSGADSPEGAMVGVVAWDDADQQRIQGRFHWEKTPTTEQVLLAQEDLWVYEALLRIIKHTNGDAKNNYDAAVKRIEFLQIGADVGKMARDAGQHPGNAGGSDAVLTNLLTGRYVDGNLTPLAAGAPAPYAEYKMMPVRMQLVVRQQRLPKLLAECANSTMPIEVRVVRLWPGAAPPIDAVASTGGEASAAAAPAAGHTAEHSDSGAGGQTEGSGKDVLVEIAGIIYIYNPPDKDRLGTGAAAQGAPAGGEAAPAEESPEGAEPDQAEPAEQPAEPEQPDEPAQMDAPDASSEAPTT